MTGKTVTRADLSDAVYREVGLSRDESGKLVESVFEYISASLVNGNTFCFCLFSQYTI
mgnify:CR=1 FL=1